jgi:hypothetical protein
MLLACLATIVLWLQFASRLNVSPALNCRMVSEQARRAAAALRGTQFLPNPPHILHHPRPCGTGACGAAQVRSYGRWRELPSHCDCPPGILSAIRRGRSSHKLPKLHPITLPPSPLLVSALLENGPGAVAFQCVTLATDSPLQHGC